MRIAAPSAASCQACMRRCLLRKTAFVVSGSGCGATNLAAAAVRPVEEVLVRAVEEAVRLVLVNEKERDLTGLGHTPHVPVRLRVRDVGGSGIFRGADGITDDRAV